MKPSESYVFLLRVWLEGTDWRWSLTSPSDKHRIGFTDLDSLYLYLSALTSPNEETNESEPKQPKE